jgi:hypothetical protein
MATNRHNGKQIFCIIRRRYVSLTPEESVRQDLIAFLINQMHYPQTLISVEAQIKVGKLNKRYDAVVYTPDWQPWLLIECKQPEVELSPSTLSQILLYNLTIRAPYLLITNGLKHFCISTSDNCQLPSLPPYPAQ